MATKQNAPYRLGEVPSPQIKALPAVITHGAKIPSRQRGIDLMRQSSMDAGFPDARSLWISVPGIEAASNHRE
jgi:hypothetical protein